MRPAVGPCWALTSAKPTATDLNPHFWLLPGAYDSLAASGVLLCGDSWGLSHLLGPFPDPGQEPRAEVSLVAFLGVCPNRMGTSIYSMWSVTKKGTVCTPLCRIQQLREPQAPQNGDGCSLRPWGQGGGPEKELGQDVGWRHMPRAGGGDGHRPIRTWSAHLQSGCPLRRRRGVRGSPPGSLGCPAAAWCSRAQSGCAAPADAARSRAAPGPRRPGRR